MVKNGCGQSGLWTLKLTLSPEWTDAVNWFFACCHKFTQIKRSPKIFGVSMVKNVCGESDGNTLKLTVYEEWTNGINRFFAPWYKFTKIKSHSGQHTFSPTKNGIKSQLLPLPTYPFCPPREMRKNISPFFHPSPHLDFEINFRYKKLIKNFLCGHGQKWVWPVWSPDSTLTVYQKLTDGINWFFACWYKSRKAKIWFNDFWMGMVKNGHDLLVQETLKSAVSWEWIYKLSWLFEWW